MLQLFVVLVMMFTFLTGIAIGIFYERSQWSKLIEDGKLPKPGQKWHRI